MLARAAWAARRRSMIDGGRSDEHACDELAESAERRQRGGCSRRPARAGACGWSAGCRWPNSPAKAGISIGALSQIERGMSSLRVRVIWPLAAALDIEPSALIADGDDTVSDLYCVRAGARRSLPVKSEGIAKAAAVAARRRADRHAGHRRARRRHDRKPMPMPATNSASCWRARSSSRSTPADMC